MSGAGRRRNSKWDFKEDSHGPIGDAGGNDWPGKSDTYFQEKDSEAGRSYPEGNSRNGGRRYDRDADDPLNSKLETRLQQSRESWSRNRGSRDGDGIIGDYVKSSKPSTEWDVGGGYDTRKSSGFDEQRQPNFRQSPKRDWVRSQRSRSRSRSRSPFYEVREESGFYDKNKNRSRLSPQPSKDFPDGRYRKGNDSREQPIRGGRPADFPGDFLEDKHRREAPGRYMHEGTSDGVFRRSRHEVNRGRDSNRRDGDVVPASNFGGGPLRRSEIPCKFFAAGNCREGKNCRFSHHGAGRENSERREPIDRFQQDHNQNDSKKSWNGPKWSDIEKSDARISSEDANASVKAVSDPKGNGFRIDDMEMSPDWNYGVQTMKDTIKKEHGQIAPILRPQSVTNESVATREQGRDSWGLDNVTTSQQLLTENDHLQQVSQHGGTNTFSRNGESVITGLQQSNHFSDVVPPVQYNQNDRISSALPYPNLQSVGERQMPMPTATTTDVSSGSNMNNPVNGTEFHEKTLIKLNMGSSTQLQVDSANLLPQNMVNTEQVDKISNLSVSLAQFFGNGQQFPQLYSTSNPHNTMPMPVPVPVPVPVPQVANSEGHVKVDSSMVGQPNQAVAFQTRDPRNDRIEPVHGNFITNEGVPEVITTQQMNGMNSDQGIPLGKLTPPVPSSILEKEPTQMSRPLNQSEPVGTSEVPEEKTEVRIEKIDKEGDDKKIIVENEDLEDADGDDKADEEKKVKDPKEMRAFKFALVEAVKELLKPVWKEGKIKKDAYKSIVKKAVDKVTGTMKAANVPQTQEKIDHYISASKPKLTKLVEAYVNKFQKS